MPNHWGNSLSLMDSDRLSADAPNRARPFLLYVPQGGQHAHLPLVRHRRALGPPSGGCVPWLSVVTLFDDTHLAMSVAAAVKKNAPRGRAS